MNPNVSQSIDEIILQAAPAVREKVGHHLRACNFTSPDDPVLNALAVQAVLANQPVRLAQEGGAKVATEAGLARLGDRIADALETLSTLRIGTIAFAVFLSCGAGCGTTALAFKLWPDLLANAINLPRATDARLRMLEGHGAELHVEESRGKTYVYFQGEIGANTGQTKDGLNFLYFENP